MKITSAMANKMIRQLNEERDFLTEEEVAGTFYEACVGEEPVIPDFDFENNNAKINEIDKKILKIKHELNVQNTKAQITVGETVMSVDEILIRLAQLNSRRCALGRLRNKAPKERIGLRYSSGQRTSVPEYRYANYDVEKAKEEDSVFAEEITKMQLALDTYNQTVFFEADI